MTVPAPSIPKSRGNKAVPSDVIKKSKADAVEAFMDLLVFGQAGFIELRQSKIKDRFQPKFSSLQVFKSS